MPLVTRTNGTVQSVSRSGGTRLAVVQFAHDPPPPDFDLVTFEVGTDDYADFRAALLADPPGKVDVTYDDAAPTLSPSGVKVHR